jgi:hypothetical protein
MGDVYSSTPCNTKLTATAPTSGRFVHGARANSERFDTQLIAYNLQSTSTSQESGQAASGTHAVRYQGELRERARGRKRDVCVRVRASTRLPLA